MDLWINAAACYPLPWDRESPGVPGAELLNKGAARRMTVPMRRAVCCALQALADAGVAKPDGIHFGTGLGQVEDTIGFLNEIEANAGGILSPTGFMRSTHNTVGGTIALLLGADGPNLTFSQGMSSFAWALQSAALQAEENGAAHILVGAADEHAPLLDELAQAAMLGDKPGAGTGFVVASPTKGPGSIGRVTGVWPAVRREEGEWWGKDDFASSAIDMVLYSNDPFTGEAPVLPAHSAAVDHRPFTGLHGSAPAQALCLALHCMRNGRLPDGTAAAVGRVLVVDRHGMETCAVLMEP
ncbi:MAG: beta-ketoacyl synthase chain length factor [Flavobacteriales bacterium]|nr:MAG: beta-ketoacyl synthase chain length factor [Flavobacteriales bacterium]